MVKMTEINQRQEKRDDASVKIKQKWQEPEFMEKMKNRKSKPKGGGSDKMKERWSDPEFKKMMLEKHKKKRENTL
jgi:hypothetical protein